MTDNLEKPPADRSGFKVIPCERGTPEDVRRRLMNPKPAVTDKPGHPSASRRPNLPEPA